ncbi:MAG TPA: (2Fe-2S)-binding protein [Anaerolineales bacterium]|nr:(2Fe-2S)-binding protein [Anaerolineales bacterium]
MQLIVNDQAYEVSESPDRPLLWVLRDELGLTGTKFGCGIGVCGSCTIHLDGLVTRACITLLSAARGKVVRTIEGLAETAADGSETLHPIQQAFLDKQVPQCGWCMPAQMMTAAALLDQNPDPNPDEIRQAMDSVYCRCGAYHRIRKAVARAIELAAVPQGGGS